MKYLFAIIALYGCSHKGNVTSDNKCDLLLKIFDEQHLTSYIASFEENFSIRITDLSSYFGKIHCAYGKYSVRVGDKLMVDLNSGRFIDICILSKQIDKRILKFEIFYSKRTKECQRDFLMKGTLIFEKSINGIKFKESKFSSTN